MQSAKTKQAQSAEECKQSLKDKKATGRAQSGKQKLKDQRANALSAGGGNQATLLGFREATH